MAPSLLLTITMFAASAIAAPQFQPPPPGTGTPRKGQLTCDISSKLVLPSTQTALVPPSSPASFVLLGVGFQNYTCTAAGTYASVGAVADLYDLSCLSKVPAFFNNIQDVAYAAWKLAPPNLKTLGPVVSSYPLMGSHFFNTSPSGTGISPVWDFRAASAKGNPDAYVLAAKLAAIPAPSGPSDIDWVQLKAVTGALATQIYRTDTRGGVPPTSCTVGSAPISLKYASKYWLYGGTVKV